MGGFFVGVDFGQSRDFTAIAVLERTETRGEWDAANVAWRKVISLHLRYLERVPLGTPYTEVVERVVQVTRWPDLAGRCHLTVDATGVGRAVVDLLRQARPGCTLKAVNITGGVQETSSGEFPGVPKRDLIIGLQVLLQRGALRIASALEHGPDLVKELAEVEVKVTPSGHEQFAVWREGRHDDLVLAVAMACWSAKKAYPNDFAGEEQWWNCFDLAEAERWFRRSFR